MVFKLPTLEKHPSRRSKRRRVDDGDNVDESPFIAKRISPRTASYCLEFGLPSRLCCSGCVTFAQSPSIGLPIDSHDPFIQNRIATVLTTRSETHSNVLYNCRQPWKWPEEDYVGTIDEEWVVNVKEFINKHHGTVRAVTIPTPRQPPPPRSTQPVSPEDDADDDPDSPAMPRNLYQTAEGEEKNDDGEKEKEDDGEKEKEGQHTQPTKKVRAVNYYKQKISSGGKMHEIEIPNSHCVIRKDECTVLKNAKTKLDKLMSVFDRERFISDSSETLKTYLAAALATTPALPISTAAVIIPLIVGGFLADQGLIQDVERFAKSFPSETFLRNLMHNQAAQCSLSLGRELRAKQVFLSCDKGNKKGIGHFVKCLSWWEGSKVDIRLLDCDASEGTNQDCALAIKASLKKVEAPEQFKLTGQSTDSGGGGVLDGLAEELTALKLTVPGYLAAPCTIHCHQLQLSRPTKDIMGEGGLDKKNVMQLLHSIYDLQESLECPEYEAALNLAQGWTNKQLAAGPIDETVGSAADKAFAKKHNKLIKFWNFTPCTPPALEGKRKKQWLKCPACVLTRWGYVGKASLYGWQHYLMLLKLCQIIINRYDSNSRPNKIASGLQPLLLEEEIFCDLALMKCFHEGCFNGHLGWFMSSNDITRHPSFQSHQIAVRYYIMDNDLCDMKTSLLTNHQAFVDFRKSLQILDDAGKSKKQANALKFVDQSIESLHKHFSRWCSKELMPAALMTEVPIAKVVAKVLLGDVSSGDPSELTFQSSVHKRKIDLVSFQTFLQLRHETEGVTDHMAIDCAKDLLNGVDYRCATTPNIQAKVTQKWLWWRCLSLASQTQFVEAGVKECKLVSTTGRGEEMRSAYAIIRSNILSTMSTNVKEMSDNQRILETIKSVNRHVALQEKFSRENPNYKAALQRIRKLLREDHFKTERLNKKREAITESAETNKKENKRQKTTGVDETATSAGLINFSGIYAKNAGTSEALKLELAFRGVDMAELRTFTDMKKALKSNEIKRVTETDAFKSADATEKKKMEATATKAFQVLSGAKFVKA